MAAQIEPYTDWWTEQNGEALARDGPLWIAIGDSTCVGIGASEPALGWVGRIAERLREVDPSWRVVNLGMSGARLEDAFEQQIPVLDALTADGQAPSLVTSCVGTNDVLWSRADAVALRESLRSLTERLPPKSVVASLAGGSSRVVLANRALRQSTKARGQILVDPWREPGPGVRERIAADRFHPNDVGHELMADAFARAIAEVTSLPGRPPPDR